MAVELTYGSHDLEPLGPESERRIVVVRRAARVRGKVRREER